MGNNAIDNLSVVQEKAILALLTAPNLEKAANASGVSPATMHRWMDDETFLAAYRKARRRAFSQALGLVHQYAPLAVQTLAKVMVDSAAPFTARVSAASALIKFSREALELDDLAERIEALEAQHGPKSPFKGEAA